MLRGLIHWVQHENLQAREVYMQAYKTIATMDDKELLCLVYSQLGVTYGQLNLIEESIDYLTKSLEISKELNNNKKLACDYTNLAYALIEVDNYPQAIGFFNQALTFAKKIPDEYMQATIMHNISRLYRLKGDYEISLQHALDAQKLAEKNNDFYNLIRIYHNISASSLKLKRIEVADKYAKLCLDLATQHNIMPLIIRVELLRAEIKLYQEKYDQAKDILLNIEKIPALKKDIESIHIYYDLMQKVYEALADYKNACNILKRLLEFEREQAEEKLKAKLETQELKTKIGIKS